MTGSYDKEEREVFGSMGEVFRETRKRTDLEEMKDVREETIMCFCQCCGSALPESSYARRCVQCTDLICNLCSIDTFQEKNMCRDCVMESIPKRIWLALHRVEHGLLPGSDTDLGGSGLVQTLFKEGLIRRDGALSNKGLFLHQLGMELYGEDPDVKALTHELNVRRVVQRR